jgi:hypothetical protein
MLDSLTEYEKLAASRRAGTVRGALKLPDRAAAAVDDAALLLIDGLSREGRRGSATWT